MFQNFQSVQVNDQESEFHGKAGHVVHQDSGVVAVVLDADNAQHEFLASQLTGL